MSRVEPSRINIAARYATTIGSICKSIGNFVRQKDTKVFKGYLRGMLRLLKTAEDSFEKTNSISNHFRNSAAYELISDAYKSAHNRDLSRETLTEIIRLIEQLEEPERCKSEEYDQLLPFYERLEKIALEQSDSERMREWAGTPDRPSSMTILSGLLDYNPYVYMP